MKGDLTKGPVMKSMLLFAIPMILGNLLQQCYNVADTLIVGQFLGSDALAAVGSAFTLMTFLTSILLGLCMGSGAVFSIRFGEKDRDGLKEGICASFALIAVLTILINLAVFLFIDQILLFLRVPDEIWDLMKEYLAEKEKMKDIYQKDIPQNEYMESGKVEKIHMDTGEVEVRIQIRDSYYYEILSDLTGITIKNEYHLIRIMKELSEKKKEFEEVSQALKDARERGYGVMKPVLSEITLSEPEVVKHGSKFGVKIRAEAPSIHLIRANLTTEIAPIVGTQLQAEDLITYIREQAGGDPKEIWNVNIFGKTLNQLVDDGISGKVTKINEDSQEKLQSAMEKIVNESSGGLICIII